MATVRLFHVAKTPRPDGRSSSHGAVDATGDQTATNYRHRPQREDSFGKEYRLIHEVEIMMVVEEWRDKSMYESSQDRPLTGTIRPKIKFESIGRRMQKPLNK